MPVAAVHPPNIDMPPTIEARGISIKTGPLRNGIAERFHLTLLDESFASRVERAFVGSRIF